MLTSLRPRRTARFAISFCALVSLAALAGCTSAPTTTSASTATGEPPQTREFNMFNVALDFNETTVGLPHDTFAPDHILVNQGDTVLIHYRNVEDTNEPHTFTMTAPYAVNDVVQAGHEANITFVASTPGIFAYRCTFHQPIMTGYIVVLKA
ncbi:MAG: cupredoxin domain-containing protein [Thermoplasmatota archaeon]